MEHTCHWHTRIGYDQPREKGEPPKYPAYDVGRPWEGAQSCGYSVDLQDSKCIGIQSSTVCLSDATLVGYLEGGDETRPVVVFSMNISVPDPPFLDVRHHRLFPVDPVGKNDLSLELFTRHRI